ncbi:alpha/beta fold hydrolase [Candidatus Leptofilum sp.]|uniref:alpha/beta fold hydrolase n=1 Tax=Candidatus Leptofilum sp. TaxID=3241576 RepID=UPI003B593753
MQLDLELYREEAQVEANVRISYIHIAPERPLHTILFVHGFGGRARQWRYQIEQFAIHNEVIGLDLRGHGRSSRPGGGYEMDRILADILAVLRHCDVNRPIVLAGHSYGVAIATEFAWRYPERVSHLILIAGAGEYNILPAYKVMFRLPEPLLRLFQPIANRAMDASLYALQEMYLHNMRHWRGWDKFPELKPKTMVILGNKDRVLPQSAFERVGELVPEGSEVINVGVSAHMVMLERRDAVNRAIERFLEGETAVPTHSRWRSDVEAAGRGGLLAERPWLANYETAVPPTIDVPRLPLTRLLDRAWRRFPNRPAIRFMGRTLSYRSMSAQAARFANGLLSLGIKKEARVMLLLPNLPHLVIAFYGTLRVGGIAVMANPLDPPEELVRQANASGAEVLVTLGRFSKTAIQIKVQSSVRHVIYASVADYLPFTKKLAASLMPSQRRADQLPDQAAGSDFAWSRWLRRFRPEPPRVTVRPEDTAVLQFTSGTTGIPKGIILTHYNLVANTMQVRLWLTDVRDGHEVMMCVVPFSHVYGMTSAMNLAVSVGASMVLLPRFDTEAVLRAIRRNKPTLFPGVPSMYVALNNFPSVRKFGIDSIRACISGAAPLPIEVKETFEKLTKGKLVEGYGLSEASPVTHANPINGRHKAGSIGLPLPSTEARIVDLKTGRPLAAGQIGELVIRGPQVMRGYWQDEAATLDVIDKDGWLHTNDVARMTEDGYFQIISRRQDSWQGEDKKLAFPRDVEEVIYELPEVREVVVVGIANQPVAFVSLKEKTRIPAKTIIQFCQRRLPPSQVPRLVIFVKEFPRSFIGKVLRRELVSQYRQQIRAEGGSVSQHLAGLDDTAVE